MDGSQVTHGVVRIDINYILKHLPDTSKWRTLQSVIDVPAMPSGVQLATVTHTGRRTVKTAEFESGTIGVSVTIPVPTQVIEAAQEACSNLVWTLIESEIESLKESFRNGQL